MRLDRRIATALVLVSVASAPAQEWRETGRAPARPLAVIAAPGGGFFGFSLDSKDNAILFSLGNRTGLRTVRLDWGPEFLGSGRNVRGDRICLPRRGRASTTLLCWDASLAGPEIRQISAPVESLALTRDDEMWVVPFRAPGVQATLVEYLKGKDSVWRESGRTLSLGDMGHSGDREAFQIHPLDEKTLLIQSLMGSFDGDRNTYPSSMLWGTETGPLRAIGPRSMTVSADTRRTLSSLRGRPLRLVYGSAASASLVAIIPVVPTADDRPPRHDEIWFRHIDGGDWQTTRLPASVTAVTLGGRDLFAATDDGRLWRRTISSR